MAVRGKKGMDYRWHEETLTYTYVKAQQMAYFKWVPFSVC